MASVSYHGRFCAKWWPLGMMAAMPAAAGIATTRMGSDCERDRSWRRAPAPTRFSASAVAKLAKMSYAALARIEAPFNRIIWNGAAAADELESSRLRSVCDIGPERRYGRVRSQARAEIFPASKMRGNSIIWTEHHLVLSRGLARPALQRSPVARAG